MKNIDLYKISLGVDTSEMLFGILAQPDEQCPNIDSVINSINKGTKSISSYLRDLNHVEGASEIASDIDSEIWSNFNLSEDIEKIRTQIIELRQWGQEWKEIAKSLLNKANESVLIEILSDEMRLKYDTLPDNQ